MVIRLFKIIFFVLIFLSLSVSAQSFQWSSSLPEEEGFSTEKLYAMRDTLSEHGTRTLLVIRNDKILLEWYAKEWHPERPHFTASLAKALVGGMSLLLALEDDRLGPDDPAWKFIPEWKDHPQKSKITIRHLATHSSGLADSQPKNKGGWQQTFWQRNNPPNDPFTISRDQTPVLFAPGTDYQYSNPGMGMLAYAVTASYKGSEYSDIRTLLQERIFEYIGLEEDDWRTGYGKTYQVDGLDLVANWGGAAFTPRAAARVGRLMLHKGNWQGRQLIDSTLVEKVITYAGTPLPRRHKKQPGPASTLGWYNNFDGILPQAPRDTFLGSGAGNQHLIVIPSLDIIVVRNGNAMNIESKGEGFYYGVEKYIVNMLMEAYEEPPYPMSDDIGKVEFAPVSSVIRKGCGSDNWPLTWADNGNMYTAYGDGWGFEPKVDKKLSLGLAMIVGGPQDFKGMNIRSETGEKVGQGRKGEKASGMLMVDGVLYMLVRNANKAGEQSQLAWSRDHGKTWTYSGWKFIESFGCPTFLNFGKNYNNARDNYVYIYSHDETSAYDPADQMVLARVPKDKITKRDEYEFLVRLENNKPVWSKDINDRGSVFKHPAGCYRSGITYNAGLDKYLWCQTHPISFHPKSHRYGGGIGIYEADEPWGPWKTVYYTRNWDMGPGETSSLPTKWMSKDGKTAYFVSSNEDCFSVRKVSFLLNTDNTE